MISVHRTIINVALKVTTELALPVLISLSGHCPVSFQLNVFKKEQTMHTYSVFNLEQEYVLQIQQKFLIHI